MSASCLLAVETGGTKILARLVGDDGATLGEGRWPTTTPDAALADLAAFADQREGRRLAAIGLASFGPLIVDPAAPDWGMMQATSKPGWTGANLARALQDRLGARLALDTDVNAAALAELALGAGQGAASLAYVTVGTGIGAGLAGPTGTLRGALHPEAGHLRLRRHPADRAPSLCPFHEDCAEGLAAGPALAARLAPGERLTDHPDIVALAAHYLGQLAAALTLLWSPHRIAWGGGVFEGAPSLLEAIGEEMQQEIGNYGVGEAVQSKDFHARAQLKNAGLEGALLLARSRALDVCGNTAGVAP